MFYVLKKEKFFLISLFLLSFFIRSLVFHFYLGKNKNYWQIDSNTYQQIALSIAKGEGISINGQPNFYRLPGYSFFLSGLYKLFGFNIKNILWIQILIASLIPLFIFLLCITLFSDKYYSNSYQRNILAKVISVYSVFHLGFILYSGFFMTESLFLFFLLLFSIFFFSNLNLFFCKSLNKKKTLSFFIAGLFLGILSLIRPIGHYLVLLSLIILFLSSLNFRQKLKNSFIFLFGWLIPVLPWLLRNYLLLGQIFFHTLPGGHFLYFSSSRILMYEKNYTYEQAQNILRKKVDKIVKQKRDILKRDLTPIEWCNIRMNLALTYFQKYPIRAFKNWILDIFRTSFSLYSSELLYLSSGRKSFNYFSKGRTLLDMIKKYLFPQTKNWYLKIIIWVEILLSLFIWIGLILGFFYSLNSIIKLNIWLKVLPFILLFLVIGLAGGYSRMRLPSSPYIIILAFSFWVELINKKLINY